MKPLHPVYFQDDELKLIDQRLLPSEELHLGYTEPEAVAKAIKDMVVRGAPAIGIAATFGMALAARQAAKLPPGARKAHLDKAAQVLKDSRPTLVNLAWAVERMMKAMEPTLTAPGFALAALLEAEAIFKEDVEACRSIGRHGAALIPDGATVLTHCNAGALATGGYGTALGVIRGAVEAGKKIKVFADETRPYLQGARLTTWELHRDGIDVTLLCDNMAGHLMQRGEITCAVVGADRIARNGDTANKIGTYTVAILCREHGLPFYVAAPLSTFDLSLDSGDGIPIEERGSEEIACFGGVRTAPENVKVYAPAFDVTPARYIAAIITERGIIQRPDTAAVARHCR